MNKPSKKQDIQHMRIGYMLLRDAIDEFAQIYRKDNTVAHAMRVLDAIEDTFYQYITESEQRRD